MPTSAQNRSIRRDFQRNSLAVAPLSRAGTVDGSTCCSRSPRARHRPAVIAVLPTTRGRARTGFGSSKKLARAQGHPIHRLRINGWKVFYAKTDIVFYFAWHAQGYTYATTSHYLGGMKPHDLRTLVASARQVPSTSGIHRGELQASRTPVYVRASAAGDERFKVHPRTLQIVATGQFRKLNWRDWGSGRTSSPGRYVYSAGGGNIKRSRGNVRLSRIRQCDGRDVYTRLRWRARGVENGRWLSGQFYPSDCSVTA